ncbi:MAG: ADP-ribosylation factor-like protein, partial [Candidatus Thorarchaeota archaeon]
KLKSYDYKVYVTGPFQAGKTTLIHTLDPSAISVEREMKEDYRGEKSTTTTGFDLGRIMWVRKALGQPGLIVPKNEFIKEQSEYDGWITKEIELRGVPGQLHFKFVRDTMRTNTDGVLVVVDSSDTGMIGEASAILAETVASFGEIPMTIVANKQDRDDAVDPFTVSAWLGVENAVGMSGKDRESSKDALIQLLNKIEKIAFPNQEVSAATSVSSSHQEV